MDIKISDDGKDEVWSSEEIMEVERICEIKNQLMQDAIKKMESFESRKMLVETMSRYFYLIDISKAKNIQAVLRMPYFLDLCPPHNSRDITERYAFYANALPGLNQDEILHLLVPNAAALVHILYSGKILTYDDMPFDSDAARKNVPEMGVLAAAYVCARDNPKTCVLPDFSDMTTTFAVPTNIPMRLDNGSVNPDFFIKWKQAVYAKFLG